MKDHIPYGYCRCGCGEKTKVSAKTNNRLGWVRGEPRDYLSGHNSRTRPLDPIWDADAECYLVPLNGDRYAKIDEVDVGKVSGRAWWSCSNTNYPYARGRINGVITSMHRYLLDPPDDKLVDHKNGDVLDNRRSNLRVATVAENVSNVVGKKANNSSGYTGVQWHKKDQTWHARIGLNGDKFHLGTYPCPIEAAIARDVAALELHGEFASLNFPELREVFAAGKGAGA